MICTKTFILRACSAVIALSVWGASSEGVFAQRNQPLQLDQQNQGKRKPAQQGEAARKQEKKRPAIEKTFPLGASWTAVRLNKKIYTGEQPTMILDRQYRVQGFAGCNTYSATSYPLRMQRIAVGPIAFTKKKCSAQVMAAEKAFLITLRGVYQWDLSGPQLILKSSDGEIAFERTL